MSIDRTLQEVLSGLDDCGSRASTPAAIAKRVSAAEGCGKCTPEYVEQVVAVLDNLPYVTVIRKPSGRLAGLEFKSGTEGACSIYYVRISPGYTLFFHGSKLVARVDARDGFSLLKTAEAELIAFAAQHKLPVLNFLTRDFLKSVYPFVKEALATEAN